MVLCLWWCQSLLCHHVHRKSQFVLFWGKKMLTKAFDPRLRDQNGHDIGQNGLSLIC